MNLYFMIFLRYYLFQWHYINIKLSHGYSEFPFKIASPENFTSDISATSLYRRVIFILLIHLHVFIGIKIYNIIRMTRA